MGGSEKGKANDHVARDLRKIKALLCLIILWRNIDLSESSKHSSSGNGTQNPASRIRFSDQAKLKGAHNLSETLMAVERSVVDDHPTCVVIKSSRRTRSWSAGMVESREVVEPMLLYQPANSSGRLAVIGGTGLLNQKGKLVACSYSFPNRLRNPFSTSRSGGFREVRYPWM